MFSLHMDMTLIAYSHGPLPLLPLGGDALLPTSPASSLLHPGVFSHTISYFYIRFLAAQLLRHGRDALLTWNSIAYWECGTKGPGSGF